MRHFGLLHFASVGVDDIFLLIYSAAGALDAVSAQVGHGSIAVALQVTMSMLQMPMMATLHSPHLAVALKHTAMNAPQVLAYDDC
jgi:CBS-domain-containing membrane protein